MGPKVFISSTYYDLKYIREDLDQFVRGYRFETVLFENGDIGYEPGKPLDESCYHYISKADMVILVVGGLYGSPATGEKQDEFKFDNALVESIKPGTELELNKYALQLQEADVQNSLVQEILEDKRCWMAKNND